MSRETVTTITTAQGNKVRTVASKRFFVVQEYKGNDGVWHIRVIHRTDSAVSAFAILKKSWANTVYVLGFDREAQRYTTTASTDTGMYNRALGEKQDKAFARSIQNNGEARRLAY